MAFLKITVLALFCTSYVLTYELPERSDAEPLKWWQEEIVYQIYPRSHQDSDGDGVGDLQGIENRLEHFVDLGVGSVWISPIYRCPMVDFGYDISDFIDIEPMFGTMESFRNMSKAMKEKGIKLIMDFVPNHSSDQHLWFEESVNRNATYEDFYVWKDEDGKNPDGTQRPPNNWVSVFGGSAWTFNETRGQFYLHQFTKEQPDLNFENPAVVQAILDAIQFWLDAGVDGFRVDAVPHLFEDQSFANETAVENPGVNVTCPFDYACLVHNLTYNLPPVFDFLAKIRNLIDNQTRSDGVERVMMVEATVPTLEKLFEYYGNSTRPIAHYPFNFEFINRIKSNFNGSHIADLVDEWFTKMPEGSTANWLLGNHDNGRVGSRFSPKVIDPFNMINLLLPGSAVTYYGEEIGMLDTYISWEDTVYPPGCGAGKDRHEQFSRDPERTPMQWNTTEKNSGFSTNDTTWLPMNPNWNTTVNVEHQSKAIGLSHLKIYKEIVKLRKTDIWRFGSMESKSIDNGALFGFTRILKQEGFLYMANFGSETRAVNLTAQFKNVPQAARVYVYSMNFMPVPPAIGLEIPTNEVSIGSGHAIILRWTAIVSTESPTPTPTTTPTTTTEGAAAVNLITNGLLVISILLSALLKV